MLTIHAFVNIKEALRRGPVTVASGQLAAIQIPDDLPDEQRKLIADHIEEKNGRYELRDNHSLTSLHVNEPTIAGVLEAIAGSEKYSADQKRRIDERDAERVASLIKAIDAREERIVKQYNDYQADAWDKRLLELPYDYSSYVKALPETARLALVDWEQDADVANELSLDAAKVRFIEIKAANQARAAAAEKERADWIAAHGSSLLQRLVAEDIEHDTQYGDERLAFEHPGWHWDCYNDCEAASSATSEAFEILDEARRSIAAAKLVELTRWRKADDDEFEDADEDGEIRQWCYAAKASFMGKAIIFNRHTDWKDA